MLQIIFQQELILGKSLNRFEKKMFDFQITTLRQFFKIYANIPELGIVRTTFVKMFVHDGDVDAVGNEGVLYCSTGYHHDANDVVNECAEVESLLSMCNLAAPQKGHQWGV